MVGHDFGSRAVLEICIPGSERVFDREEFLFVDRVIQLGASKLSTVEGNRVPFEVEALLQEDTAQSPFRAVSFNSESLSLVHLLQYRVGRE